MKTFNQLIEDCLGLGVKELFPWDLEEELSARNDILIIDIREPYEYEAMRIQNSINVPRGILEAACEYDYEDTVPELAVGRDQNIVVVCRSGNRSVLACHTMQLMGFQNVRSLKTGLRGWNDYEQPLINAEGTDVDIDYADEYFATRLKPEQMKP
ncbi:MAG: rhodanese-like domain-containing protein [Gammaproteobacteria bacterium]|nr:rhodanese-like domain-containing protein [Gammaproteobacteria bacterium]MDH5801805.1 rhodanese-like domain-containing protein [Gammaproteobacteria bacterium]